MNSLLFTRWIRKWFPSLPSTSSKNTSALKSSLFIKSNDLGGYCSGPAKRILGPFTQAQYNRKPKYQVWQYYLWHTPSTTRGVHRACKTGSNEPQRLFARSRNNLSGGYTFHDFVTARPRCAITTALQSSTSIYRGLLVVPKVESTLPLNPHSLISTNLSVGAPAGTHPSPFQEALLTHSSTTQTTAFKAPTVTFWLGMIRRDYIHATTLIRFNNLECVLILKKSELKPASTWLK